VHLADDGASKSSRRWVTARQTVPLAGSAPGGLSPGATSVALVRQYLRCGFVDLKLHPTVGNYPADTSLLNPYLELARRQRVPVAIHSAPGTADPDAIRRLAERFPEVPILLYHTYLGPVEGRRRAVKHVHAQPNLYRRFDSLGSSGDPDGEVSPRQVADAGRGGRDWDEVMVRAAWVNRPRPST